MARGSEMQLVDLESASAGETAESAPSPTRRRARWWMAGVVALVVLGLLAGQWIVDGRARADEAQLLSLPGVVGLIGPELAARPVTEEVVAALWGMRSAVTVAADGAQSVTWQPEDGSRSWTVELMGPTAELAVEGARSTSSCQPDAALADEPSRHLVCAVSDRGWVPTADGDGSALQVQSTRDEVVVLAASDGAVVARWPVPEAASVATVDGLVVVATQDGDDAVVTAQAMTTGVRRWMHRVTGEAIDEAAGSFGVGVGRVGQVLAVQSTGPSVTLLRADGTEVRTISSDASFEDGGSVYCGDGDLVGVGPMCSVTNAGWKESVLLLADDADPAGDRVLTGRSLRATVDDGSVPGLVLTTDGTLRAWDASSGRAVWTLAGTSGTSGASGGEDPNEALVLGGLVYVVTGGSLTALDGRAGDVRWQGANDGGALATGLFTDGRHVVATYESGSGDDDSYLVAFDPRSGERLFRADYPAGVDRLTAVSKELVGYADDDQGAQDFSLVE